MEYVVSVFLPEKPTVLSRGHWRDVWLRMEVGNPPDPFADENPAVPPGAGEADAEREEAAELEEQQIERHEAEEPG